MRSWWSSRLLEPASVDRQFGRCGSQTLTLGLQVGSFGALCWRRPEFHPGVFAQHVGEPERVGQEVKEVRLLLFIFYPENKPSLRSGPTCWCCCPGSTGPPWAPWAGTGLPAAGWSRLCSQHETGRTFCVRVGLRPPNLDTSVFFFFWSIQLPSFNLSPVNFLMIALGKRP